MAKYLLKRKMLYKEEMEVEAESEDAAIDYAEKNDDEWISGDHHVYEGIGVIELKA